MNIKTWRNFKKKKLRKLVATKYERNICHYLKTRTVKGNRSVASLPVFFVLFFNLKQNHHVFMLGSVKNGA